MRGKLVKITKHHVTLIREVRVNLIEGPSKGLLIGHLYAVNINVIFQSLIGKVSMFVSELFLTGKQS